jgi:hypothetical protein
MSEARDLFFLYNGVELTDESVENVPAELPLPIKGGTMRRGGKVWTVVEVRKTEARFNAGGIHGNQRDAKTKGVSTLVRPGDEAHSTALTRQPAVSRLSRLLG